MKSNISAIILSKNEQDRIEKCLESLLWTDERIVIDNGSTDKTVELAKKHGAKIIVDTSPDFSKLRNFGKEHARSDWVIYVDADEQVTPQLRSKLEKVVTSFLPETTPHGYFIKRQNLYLGRPWPYQDKMQRFFWKKSLIKWEGALHETAIVDGPVGVIDEPLLHDTHRTLEEMVQKTNQWSLIEAQLRLQAHHPPVEWWRLLRVTATGFLDSFIRQRGWEAGIVGWIESLYQGFSMFITYAKLWELQHRSTKE